MKYLESFPCGDYSSVKARAFELMLASHLSTFGKIERQIRVENRGDGYRGYVDLVFYSPEGQRIGIEVDWKSARKKSIFKLGQLNADAAYVVLRGPYSFQKIL